MPVVALTAVRGAGGKRAHREGGQNMRRRRVERRAAGRRLRCQEAKYAWGSAGECLRRDVRRWTHQRECGGTAWLVP